MLVKDACQLVRSNDVSTTSQIKEQYYDTIKIVSDFITDLSRSCLYNYISGDELVQCLGHSLPLLKTKVQTCLKGLVLIRKNLSKVFHAFGDGSIFKLKIYK